MTKEEALKLALDALRMADELCRGHGVDFKEYGLEFDADIQVKYREAIIAIEEALAQPAQEAASIIQAVTDPENQPSQYGTVTLDYHLAKIKEWEDRFERMSDLALAQPEERNFCPRCGKRLGDMRITDAQWSNIHTCTPPDATGSEGFYGLPHGLEKRQTSGGNGVTAGETAPPKEIDPNQWAFDNGLEST